MDTVGSIVAIPWVADLLKRLLIVVVASFVIALLGIAIAIKEKKFEWEKMAEYLGDWVLPYSLAYTIVHVTVNLVLMAGFEFYGLEEVLSQAVAYAIYGTLILSLVAHIAGQLAVFLPGFGKVTGALAARERMANE